MNIRNMNMNQLEELSHLDIAYNILKLEKSKLNTLDLLKEVCDILKYKGNEYEDLIGDFYTSLNLDKRFILIDGKWDLTENHSVKMVVEDDLDDDMDEYEEIDEEDEEPKETEDEAVMDDVKTLEDVEDDLDDDMGNLTVVDEDDLDDEDNL